MSDFDPKKEYGEAAAIIPVGAIGCTLGCAWGIACEDNEKAIEDAMDVAERRIRSSLQKFIPATHWHQIKAIRRRIDKNGSPLVRDIATVGCLYSSKAQNAGQGAA